ncbi:hypothetical protein AHAS_Ahas20G0129600 [Arachis hypogaea]
MDQFDIGDYYIDEEDEEVYIEDGDFVLLKSTTLAKRTYLKLQPHTKDFMDLSNIKAILEINLRSFSCVITASLETDYEVDFVPPLDYKEEVKKQLSSTSSSKKQQQKADDTDILTKIGEFVSFSGFARHLDGKPSIPSNKQASSSSCMAKQQGDDEHKSSDSKSSSNNVSSTTFEKLLFGSRPHKASQKSTTQESHHKTETTQKP